MPQGLALVMIDLDLLKEINDEHGHAASEVERVQAPIVAQDETLALQSLGAREHGSGREGHCLGQFQVGGPAVGLQHSEDAQVDAVEVAG